AGVEARRLGHRDHDPRRAGRGAGAGGAVVRPAAAHGRQPRGHHPDDRGGVPVVQRPDDDRREGAIRVHRADGGAGGRGHHVRGGVLGRDGAERRGGAAAGGGAGRAGAAGGGTSLGRGGGRSRGGRGGGGTAGRRRGRGRRSPGRG